MTKQDTLILKGLGIIAMLVLHLYDNNFCKICVATFVFASGYGMAIGLDNVKKNSMIDNNLSIYLSIIPYIKFIIKRLVKFYISYWSVFLIFVPISVFVFGRGLDEAYGACGFSRLIADFFCVGTYNYDVHWWFNTMILIIYLISPLLYFLVKKIPIITLLVFLLLTKYALYDNYFPYIPDYPFLFQVYQLNIYLFVFVFAMAFALYKDKISDLEKKINNPQIIVGIYFIITILLCVLHETSFVPFFHGWRVEAFILLFLSLMITHLSAKLKYSSIALKFCGKHSANIYLFHYFVILWWLKEVLFQLGSSSIIMIVSLVICLVGSYLIETLKHLVGVYKLEYKVVNLI